jgi:hypothetical protein
MPYTFMGVGTTYYGNRERTYDDFYTTTLWITALMFPVVPLASYRVRSTGYETKGWIITSTRESYIARRIPLCWHQVLNVYLAAVTIPASCYLAVSLGFRYLEAHPQFAKWLVGLPDLGAILKGALLAALSLMGAAWVSLALIKKLRKR